MDPRLRSNTVPLLGPRASQWARSELRNKDFLIFQNTNCDMEFLEAPLLSIGLSCLLLCCLLGTGSQLIVSDTAPHSNIVPTHLPKGKDELGHVHFVFFSGFFQLEKCGPSTNEATSQAGKPSASPCQGPSGLYSHKT